MKQNVDRWLDRKLAYYRSTSRTAFSIEYGAKGSRDRFGAFSTERDAQRYLEDNPLSSAVVFKTSANATCDWGADCPQCKRRAERAWDLGYTGSIELWWRCPDCKKEFTR